MQHENLVKPKAGFNGCDRVPFDVGVQSRDPRFKEWAFTMDFRSAKRTDNCYVLPTEIS